METFQGLKNHTKVVDKIQENGKRLDGQIVEYLKDKHGDEYLADDRSMWPLYQFSAADYEIYNGDKKVGEYLD